MNYFKTEKDLYRFLGTLILINVLTNIVGATLQKIAKIINITITGVIFVLMIPWIFKVIDQLKYR